MDPRRRGELRTGSEPMPAMAAVALFSLALSIGTVAAPILIVQAGYHLTHVGFFVALSAVSQIAARVRIGAVMRLLPEKHIVAISVLLMGLGSTLLAWSAALVAILASQLLQGAARGFFWTGIQTHAVRTSSAATRSLAAINLASGVGLILGPVLAGLLIEASAQLAMVGAALSAFAAFAPVLLMIRLAPFPSRKGNRTQGRVSRRPGVRAGSLAIATAGAWRGLMGAYVPIALHHAGHSSTAMGAVVAMANLATIVTGWSARWLQHRLIFLALPLGTSVTGLGLAAVGPAAAADLRVVAAAAVIASGLGAGILQTVGPALAAETVGAEERGDAMAAVGLYRAGATFAAPFGVAAVLLAMPLGPALFAAGALIALPAVSMRRLSTRPS